MTSPNLNDIENFDLCFDNFDLFADINDQNDNDRVLPFYISPSIDDLNDQQTNSTIATSPQDASKNFGWEFDRNKTAQTLTVDSNNDQNIMVKSTDVADPPNFLNDSQQQWIHIEVSNPIGIHIQPESNYHVRYEADNKPSPRYTKAVDKKPIRINFSPDLSGFWKDCREYGFIPWLRITRTTVRNSNDICRHPYPIWMKSSGAKVYDGSIYIRITDDDILNGCIKIDNLVMLNIKQDKLATMDKFAIYNPSQTVFLENCSTNTTNAKTMINKFSLCQSKLYFQIMVTDSNNIVYPTDCCCDTIAMTQYTGSNSKKFSSETNEQSSSKKRKRNEEQESLLTRKPKKIKSSSKPSSSINKSGHT
ncbi:unnamed protein product [Adineta steineri]|uniref:Uncharacterized protein n=2 Tax=Adineta steineri TaxID=433720 RepID=A0A818LPS1_9BILA|nr:unnamed protein product [Adineta steineri]CAF3572091.1 unnamed protein product [Adineta steineri]